jgi:hypothetical protein
MHNTYPQMPLHRTWTMQSSGLGCNSGEFPMYISWFSLVKRAGFLLKAGSFMLETKNMGTMS